MYGIVYDKEYKPSMANKGLFNQFSIMKNMYLKYTSDADSWNWSHGETVFHIHSY